MLIRDKEYEIKFTMNTLCVMTEQGVDLEKIGENPMANLTFTRDLFYYGLKHADKKLTKNQAGDLMDAAIEDGSSLNEIYLEIMMALGKSLGFAEELEKAAREQEEEEEAIAKIEIPKAENIGTSLGDLFKNIKL